MKMTISIEESVKKKAENLSKEVRLSMSEIIELLLLGTTEKDILNLYNKKEKKNK